MSVRKKLRELIARPGYTIVPGAYDPLIARLVQVAGFEPVSITGGGTSRSQGHPDMGLLTLTENVQTLCRIDDAVVAVAGVDAPQPGEAVEGGVPLGVGQEAAPGGLQHGHAAPLVRAQRGHRVDQVVSVGVDQ